MARGPDRHGRYRFCFLVLLCLVPASSVAQELPPRPRPQYWAIDCGATESFNSTANITWQADGNYTHGGVIKTVSTATDETFKTLRAFEAEKPAKGCYTVPVGEGKKVQVSAWFYYGNYDGLNKPPTFQLQFDGNDWGTVATSSESWTTRRAVYVAKANATSICVAREDRGDTPFISTLHVVVLDEAMYPGANSSRALFMLSRVAFGTDRTIRDDYFRDWGNTTATLNVSDYKILNNAAGAAIDTSNLTNEVPPEVFQTAITPNNEAGNITIRTPFLTPNPIPIYFAMYFTEPESNEKRKNRGRSFRIFVDDKLLMVNGSGDVRPLYESAMERFSAGFTASNTTVFELVPIEPEALPPVISAWELFNISGVLSDGTNSSDVSGLAKLQERFETLQAWAGDPCLPLGFSWEWVKCSREASPRITELDLSGYGLSGILPNFRSLDALQTIDLSNNNLTGEVPAFLAGLPNLQTLNLANNHFTGIPAALQSSSSIQLNVTGNPKLACGGPACNRSPQDLNKNPSVKHNGTENSSVKDTGRGAFAALLLVSVINIFAAAAAVG